MNNFNRQLKVVFSSRGHRPGERGQILLEVLIALAAVATISATIATLIVVAQRGQENARRRDIAAGIASEVFAALSSIIQSDVPSVAQGYNRVYCPPGSGANCETYPVTAGKDASTDRYHPVLVGNHWELVAGQETRTVEDIGFTSSVIIENVCRDSLGAVLGVWVDPNGMPGDCAIWYGAGATDDPYTQKISTIFTAPQMQDLTVSQFLTRSRTTPAVQSAWSGPAIDDISGNGVIEFSVNWDNDDDASPPLGSDPVKIFLCKTSAQPLNLECPDGSWTETPTYTSTSPEILTYAPNPADIGVNEFWVYICDGVGQCSLSDNGGDPDTWPNYGTFTVN